MVLRSTLDVKAPRGEYRGLEVTAASGVHRATPLTHQATAHLSNDEKGRPHEDLKLSIRRIARLEYAFGFERDRLARAHLVAVAAMHGGDSAAIAAAPRRLDSCRTQLLVPTVEESKLYPHQDALRTTHGVGCSDAGKVLAMAHLRTGRPLRSLARLYRSLQGRETIAKAWLVYADATLPIR